MTEPSSFATVASAGSSSRLAYGARFDRNRIQTDVSATVSSFSDAAVPTGPWDDIARFGFACQVTTARLDVHGGRRCRKMKGDTTVRLVSGALRRAEIHWYEAHGVGKRGLTIKRFLD
jgi:hypothetical protein